MIQEEIQGDGLLQYSSSAQQVLDTAGNKKISKDFIKRSPVPKLLTGALSAFSMGKFGKRMYRNFDELFHLYCEVVLENVKTILVEKNERINIQKISRNESNTETQEVTNVPPNLTLNTLLNKTKAYMGDKKFFTYNAVSNNCQDFILAFLQSNSLGTPENYAFVKQDTEQLFKRLPVLQKIAKKTTDLDALMNFFSGRGLPL